MNDYLLRSSTVVGQLLPDEAVLVMPASGDVKVLNDVGARIWSLADGTHTLNDIVALICQEYEADRQQVTTDVADFATELVQRKMASLITNNV